MPEAVQKIKLGNTSPSKIEPNKEEKIVQRIVELLNERGYEYERDARPIICWKYKVASSRELTLEQKEEVKNSLENGSFEQWGIEYRDQVLGQEVDIVKQINDLKDNVEVSVNSDEPSERKTVVEENEPSKKSAGKIKINMVSKQEPDNESADQQTIKEPDSKIAIPADRIKISTSNNASKKEDKKLIEASSIKLAPSSKPKATKAVKQTEIDKKLDENETIDNITAVAPIEINSPEAENEIDEKCSTVKSKKDLLKVDSDDSNPVGMDIEEAKEIVKNCFSLEHADEPSIIYSLLVSLSLLLLGMSLYINYIMLFSKNFPEWLNLVCNILR